MEEQEEFEFRNRLENEQAAAPTSAAVTPAAPPEPSWQDRLVHGLQGSDNPAASRPTSWYADKSYADLPWYQKVDKALSMPGHEMVSDPALAEKKKGLETAVNTFPLFGHLPQAYGAVKSGSISGPDYLQNRDAMVSELGSADPGTKAAGIALGILPTLGSGSLLPLAKSIPGRIMQGTAIGAVTGGLSNPGDEKGVYDPIQAGSRLRNAGIGAVMGFAGSTLANLPAMKDYFQRQANMRALKQGGAMLGDQRAFDHQGRLDSTGQMMMTPQEGPNGEMIQVLTPGASTSDVADKAGKLVQEHGNRIGQAEDAVDQAFPQLVQNPEMASKLFNPERTAQRIEDEIIAPTIGTAMEEETTKAQSLVDNLRAMGSDPVRLADAKRQLKSAWDLVNFSKEQTPSMELLKKASGIVNNEIEGSMDAIGQATGFPLFEKWKQSKQIYGSMKQVRDMAEDKIFRNASNRLYSPSDYGASALGGILSHGAGLPGKAATMAASGISNNIARRYGNSFMALGENSLSKTLSNPYIQQAGQVAAPQVNKALVAGSQAMSGATPQSQPREDSSQVIGRLNQAGLSHYANVLQQAAQQSPQQYAAKLYIMNQQFPDFRQAVSPEQK